MDQHRTIIVLGAAGCGKTALITRYGEDRFVDVYEPTLESNYTISTQHHQQAMVLRLREIGAGGFPARATAGVDGYVLVFSCASASSFQAIVQLHDTLAMLVGNPSAVARILVAMHADGGSSREVQRSVALAQAQQWRCPYVEASAKEGDGITRVFQTILSEIDALNSFGGRTTRENQQLIVSADTPSHTSSCHDTGKKSCCSAFLQAVSFGYYRSWDTAPPPPSPHASPTDGLRQSLLSHPRAVSAPTSPTELASNSLSPFGFKKVYPEGAVQDQSTFLRPPSQEIDVGSMKTGIQLAPYPVGGYSAAALRPDVGLQFLAFADGAGYLLRSDRSSQGFVMDAGHGSAEDGSTGGTPHFDSDVLQRLSVLAARDMGISPDAKSKQRQMRP